MHYYYSRHHQHYVLQLAGSVSCLLITASDNLHKLTTQLIHVYDVGYLLILVNTRDMMLVIRSLLVLRTEDNDKQMAVTCHSSLLIVKHHRRRVEERMR